ncbi:MAG: 6-pyruvoyl-tetrahydropterin synthase-related protein [Anaerolineae bacterium]
MHRDRLRTILELLVLSALLLPALVPLLRTTALPCTHDNVFHSFRIVAMREMLRHGWLFSRWVPNLALGYGYPFFNYREPLPYLVGEGLFTVGLPLPLVLGLIYALSLVMGAYGAFRLARDLWGREAAWIAGVAYGLAPYVLLDPLRRGNMPESVALAILPWLFVTTRRIVRGGGKRPLVATLLLLASLFLSHNISSLLLAPFLGLYVVLLAWIYRGRRAWPYAFVVVMLATLITAWFWMPALAERDFVQLHLSRTTRNNDFHYNFVTWREMLTTLAAPYDRDYLNPPMRIYLGVAQGLLALIGVGVAAGKTFTPLSPEGDAQAWEGRLLPGCFLVASLGYLWMATPAAVGVWERLPLLSFVQFPWRLVGRAALPVALLAGLGVQGVVRSLSGVKRIPGWLPRAVLIVVVAVLVVAAWPDMHPPKGTCSAAPRPSLDELYALERDGWIGMDPESSYFPIWVESHPTDTTLAEAFQRGELPQRFDPESLPQGAEVLSASYKPLRATLQLSAPIGFRARWLGLYFPGWQVLIDGQRVQVGAEDDTGLLTFRVPAGEHDIDVRFGSTPVRRIGVGLALVGIVGAVVAACRPHSPVAARQDDRDPDTISYRDANAVRAAAADDREASAHPFLADLSLKMAGLAVGLLAVRYLVVPSIPTPMQRPRLGPTEVPDVATAIDKPFAGGLSLVGVTLPSGSYAGDAEIPVELVWKARSEPAADYRTTVVLRGEDGQVWSTPGTARPRGYETPPPTRAWSPGAYAFDPHILALLPGAPPGAYELVAVLLDAETMTPISVLDEAGRPSEPKFSLGTVAIGPPSRVASLEELGVPEDANLQVCEGVGLWSMELDRAAASPGGVVAVRWVWEAVVTPVTDRSVWLRLVDESGLVAETWTLSPSLASWPSSRWSSGERWLGQHVLRLPGSLESGVFRLVAEMTACGTPVAQLDLIVEAPDRAWMVPDDLLPANVVFGDGAPLRELVMLAGYRVSPPVPQLGDVIEVDLAWRGLAEMDQSYHVFVHLVDPDGLVLSQSDGEPAAWSRPTTGWAPDEVVTESRTVTLPSDAGAGDYVLRVGLYIPGSARLRTEDGGDAALLATFEVEP